VTSEMNRMVYQLWEVRPDGTYGSAEVSRYTFVGSPRRNVPKAAVSAEGNGSLLLLKI